MIVVSLVVVLWIGMCGMEVCSCGVEVGILNELFSFCVDSVSFSIISLLIASIFVESSLAMIFNPQSRTLVVQSPIKRDAV